MKTIKRYYTATDGRRWPLYEAPYKYDIHCYRKDCRKAIQSDPEHCLIALGAMRDRAVLAAFIGASKDAYIVFKATQLMPAHALHYTINTEAARVRDYFDRHKGIETKTITLSRPTAGRTLAHRAHLNKRREKAIKAGMHQVKKRNKPNQRQRVIVVTREGAEHYRPRAVVQRDVVTVPELTEA